MRACREIIIIIIIIFLDEENERNVKRERKGEVSGVFAAQNVFVLRYWRASVLASTFSLSFLTN